MPSSVAYVGASIFDGYQMHEAAGLIVQDNRVASIVPQQDISPSQQVVELNGGLIAPGLVDLQANGGGGLMLNNSPDLTTLRGICAAHGRVGTTSVLPTLITDKPSISIAAMGACRQAAVEKLPGMLGLHLEGPHLSTTRKGAHAPELIRRMEEADCARLEQLASDLPTLFLTVAPESVDADQIKRLVDAGAVLSLGHTDATSATVDDFASHGVTCATHLFNAMSQFTGREPGMVGSTLNNGAMFAGLIADGIHVDAGSIRLALRAKNGPGKIFLVSDCMATVGSDVTEFDLNGRQIFRRNGRLELADGTLAGADIDLITAVRFMVREIGTELEEALRMASLYPALLLGKQTEIGSLKPGSWADFIHLDDNIQVAKVWCRGAQIDRKSNP